MAETELMRGVVHGSSIQLSRNPGIPDGQEVVIALHPANKGDLPQQGEGLRQAFGAWSEDGEQLDSFIEQVYRDRDDQRREKIP